MSKRGIIIGGGLVVLLGIGCLGLTTLGGVGAWFVLTPSTADSEYREFMELSDPMNAAEPAVAEPVFDVLEADGTEADTEADTDADTDVQEEAVVTAPAPRPRRSAAPAPEPAPRPFSAPGERPEPIPEEENLDDMDLERTPIEIIDEELTPRERRRRRREGRD